MIDYITEKNLHGILTAAQELLADVNLSASQRQRIYNIHAETVQIVLELREAEKLKAGCC